jgi:hypothetical protein
MSNISNFPDLSILLPLLSLQNDLILSFAAWLLTVRPFFLLHLRTSLGMVITFWWAFTSSMSWGHTVYLGTTWTPRVEDEVVVEASVDFDEDFEDDFDEDFADDSGVDDAETVGDVGSVIVGSGSPVICSYGGGVSGGTTGGNGLGIPAQAKPPANIRTNAISPALLVVVIVVAEVSLEYWLSDVGTKVWLHVDFPLVVAMTVGSGVDSGGIGLIPTLHLVLPAIVIQVGGNAFSWTLISVDDPCPTYRKTCIARFNPQMLRNRNIAEKIMSVMSELVVVEMVERVK